jgi:hypothetical protein
MAHSLVPVPDIWFAPELATTGKAAKVPASDKGSTISEECCQANMAVFLGLCDRKDLMATARQLSGFLSGSTDLAYQSN